MTHQRLVVDRLRVFSGSRPLVHEVSFTLEPGRILALVGESGSGKSITARSLVGLSGEGLRVEVDKLTLGGQDLSALTERQWRDIRGREIGFVLQDALVSLDPLRPVGREIEEALAAHGGYRGFSARHARRDRAVALLERAGVSDAAARAQRRPDQLSGGQRQRALIASAIALDPAVLIADEPTTALDATAAARILELFRQIRDGGQAVLLISHDLAAVARIADDVLVMRDGRAVEHGPAREVLRMPQHPYTRMLLDSVPGRSRAVPAEQARDGAPVILAAEGIGKRYVNPSGGVHVALDKVDFELRRGRTLGILGESGSGKTTVARILAGFLIPDVGRVTFDGAVWNQAVAAGSPEIRESARRAARHKIGFIYQDPLSSFDPRWTVRRILDDALAAIAMPAPERPARIDALLGLVRLGPETALQLPLQLSGGQRQRVAIARALATEPSLIICDEPVSALDVSVQAQVLHLLADLQTRLGLSYLFISHDLAVIRQVSDEVLVMRDGRVEEHGTASAVFDTPRAAFTRELIASAAV